MAEKVSKLEQLAQKAVKRYPTDRDKATEQLAAAIARDKPLIDEALHRLSRLLVNEMVRALHFAHMRRSMPKLAQEIRDSLGGILESWSLPSGIVLGDARRADLDSQINHLLGVRRGIDVRISFLTKIRGRLVSDEQSVREVVSNAEADELFASVQESASA